LLAISILERYAHSKNTRRERRRRESLNVRALWALANDPEARRRRETLNHSCCNAINNRDFWLGEQAIISQRSG
jgi:hypothetical protein